MLACPFCSGGQFSQRTLFLTQLPAPCFTCFRPCAANSSTTTAGVVAALAAKGIKPASKIMVSLANVYVRGFKVCLTVTERAT